MDRVPVLDELAGSFLGLFECCACGLLVLAGALALAATLAGCCALAQLAETVGDLGGGREDARSPRF